MYKVLKRKCVAIVCSLDFFVSLRTRDFLKVPIEVGKVTVKKSFF